MSVCVCDGPPHPYDPSWCGAGKRSRDGGPVDKRVEAAELELRAARLRAEADRDRFRHRRERS